MLAPMVLIPLAALDALLVNISVEAVVKAITSLISLPYVAKDADCFVSAVAIFVEDTAKLLLVVLKI